MTRCVCAAENELEGVQDAGHLSPAPEPVSAKRTNVWQDTFSPQMNSNLKRLPKSYYDAPQEGHKETVWEHIIKADTIRQVAFQHFDKNRAPPLFAPGPHGPCRSRAQPRAAVSYAWRHATAVL